MIVLFVVEKKLYEGIYFSILFLHVTRPQKSLNK